MNSYKLINLAKIKTNSLYRGPNKCCLILIYTNSFYDNNNHVLQGNITKVLIQKIDMGMIGKLFQTKNIRVPSFDA